MAYSERWCEIMEFLYGVLGSLTTAAVCALVAFMYREKIRNLISNLLFNISNVGAMSVYTSSHDDDFMKDLKKEIEKAKKIKIFTSRGRFLGGAPFLSAFANDDVSINILLPNTKEENPNWIELNSKVMHEHNKRKYDKTSTKKEIEAIVSALKRYEKKTIEIKLYHTVHICKMVMTENVVFFVPYRKDIHSGDTTIYKYSSKSDIYKWCEWLFEKIWETSEDAIYEEETHV